MGADSEETPSRARGGGRIPASEIAKRLRDTEHIILLAGTDRRAAVSVAEKFGLSLAQAMEYCRRVRDAWRRDASEFWERYGRDPIEVREEHRQRFAMLFARALTDKNLKAALAAAERMGQLDGMFGSSPPMLKDRGGDAALDAVARALAEERDQVRAAIEQAGGLGALLTERPAMPDAIEIDPRGELAKRDKRIAELETELKRRGGGKP